MKRIMGSIGLNSLLVLLSSTTAVFAQENYVTKNGHVSFFSNAPIADVDAQNDNVAAALNPETREISIELSMADFAFKSKKMGRDAEKKYLETVKFPKANFKGKINGKIDFKKPGTYPATATGKLNIHGTEQDVTQKGTITVVKEGEIKLQSEFRVMLKDHNIDRPEILGKEMTEDHVLVKVDATLSQKQPTDTASKK